MGKLASLVVLAAVIGCGGDPARGSVDVVAHFDPRTPLADALVVFEDLDGTSRTATTDGDGKASGQIEPGGRVWLSRSTPLGDGGADITAYTDVQPGTMLAFGPDAEQTPTLIATMEVSGTPPAGASFIAVTSTCPGPPPGRIAATFDDRCSGTADVLLTAVRQNTSANQIVGYIYLPALAIMDGGTITVDPNAWKPPEDVTIQLVHAAEIASANNLLFIDSSFGFHAYFQLDAAHMSLTTKLPLVGLLRVSGGLLRPGYIGQRFARAPQPAAPTLVVDLDQTLGPWVMQPDYANYTQGSSPWSSDGGGVRTAQVLVREYQWQQPIANFVAAVQVRIIESVETEGTIDRPQLPEPLGVYQPRSDYQVGKLVRLLRAEGVTPADLPRAAELASSPDVFSVPPSVHATSLAITSAL